jgi:membrane-bound serine protease (ClpP class)
MKARRSNLARIVYVGLAALAALTMFAAPTRAQGNARHVDWIEAKGEIAPVMLSYVKRAVTVAESDGATALIIQLNTPGGDINTMQEMVQTIRASSVPVIVYVAPRGAWAGSAGTLITLAGHVAVMAPETAIGAASPIGVGSDGSPQELPPTLKAKEVQAMQALARSLAVRRSAEAIQLSDDAIANAKAVSAQEALSAGLVDFMATDMNDLLQKVNGFQVDVNGRIVTLQTAGASLQRIPPSPAESLLNILANPNISFLLLAVGVQALLIELSNPGMWIPGFVGVVCLALFVYSIGVIPVNLLGLVFIVTAFVLFVLDVKAPTHGALTAAGVASFIAGALVMFNSPLQPGQIRVQPISIPLVVAVALGNGAFFAFIVGKALQAQSIPLAMGMSTLVGRIGEARTDLNPEGTIYVASELWTAEAQEGNISTGQQVQVIGADGVKLRVKRKD